MAAAGVIFLWVFFLAGGPRVGARHRLITGAEVSYEAVGESDMEGSVPSDLAEQDPIMNFESARVATNMCMKRGVMDAPMSFNVKGVCARYQCTKSLGRHTDIATIQPERCPMYKNPCVVPDKVKFLEYPKCCAENCARHIGSMARFPFIHFLVKAGKAVYAAGQATIAIAKAVISGDLRRAIVTVVKSVMEEVAKKVAFDMAENRLKSVLEESNEIIEHAKKLKDDVIKINKTLPKTPSKEQFLVLLTAEDEARLATFAAKQAKEAAKDAKQLQEQLNKKKKEAEEKKKADTTPWYQPFVDIFKKLQPTVQSVGLSEVK